MAADPNESRRLKSLSLDPSPSYSTAYIASKPSSGAMGDSSQHLPQRPALQSSATSQETIRATAPMTIPTNHEQAVDDSLPDDSHSSYMDHYMRSRQPSISFSTHVKTDSGDSHSIDEPLPKPVKIRPRGRSMIQALAEAQKTRSHSESTRDHYDPITGRHLPEYSTSPPRDEPHIGEARFPLLQRTVDEMARESRPQSPQTLSLTTGSTPSAQNDALYTPRDEVTQLPLSPVAMSPSVQQMATSYESSRASPRPFKRSASERWRNGESAQDFLSKAGSMKKSDRTSSWRSFAQRDTAGSTKSPSSVASSFLRGFSLGSGGDDGGGSTAVDAEGQTIGDDYVIGKQIGFGGFSVIKEVTQMSAATGQQRRLAVKIVRRNIEGKSDDENESAQAEFEHEVELWRFLNHPNILPLEAVYKLEEATFCFIPLNTGGTLFDLIRGNRGGLPTELVCNYAYQITSALRYLHLDARVVHRDIKLENCLIDTTRGGSGIIRLCDFGMAEWLSNDGGADPRSPDPSANTGGRPPQKFMGPADSSTAAFAGGSLEYAAPEIVQRATAENTNESYFNDSQAIDGQKIERSIVSPAVDMWALGVCLFSLIMGKRPFSDAFMPRVVMAILACDWDREALRQKLGDSEEADNAWELIDGCLTRNEQQRLTVTDMIESAWFDVERAKERDEENAGSRAWRL